MCSSSVFDYPKWIKDVWLGLWQSIPTHLWCLTYCSRQSHNFPSLIGLKNIVKNQSSCGSSCHIFQMPNFDCIPNKPLQDLMVTKDMLFVFLHLFTTLCFGVIIVQIPFIYFEKLIKILLTRTKIHWIAHLKFGTLPPQVNSLFLQIHPRDIVGMNQIKHGIVVQNSCIFIGSIPKNMGIINGVLFP